MKGEKSYQSFFVTYSSLPDEEKCFQDSIHTLLPSVIYRTFFLVCFFVLKLQYITVYMVRYFKSAIKVAVRQQLTLIYIYYIVNSNVGGA